MENSQLAMGNNSMPSPVWLDGLARDGSHRLFPAKPLLDLYRQIRLSELLSVVQIYKALVRAW
jgi:hypothetical protein